MRVRQGAAPKNLPFLRVSIHALMRVRLRYQLNLTETRQFQSTHS